MFSLYRYVGCENVQEKWVVNSVAKPSSIQYVFPFLHLNTYRKEKNKFTLSTLLSASYIRFNIYLLISKLRISFLNNNNNEYLKKC